MIDIQLILLILFPYNRVSGINSIDLKYPFYFGLNNYIIKTRKMQPRKCGFETLLTLYVYISYYNNYNNIYESGKNLNRTQICLALFVFLDHKFLSIYVTYNNIVFTNFHF